MYFLSPLRYRAASIKLTPCSFNVLCGRFLSILILAPFIYRQRRCRQKNDSQYHLPWRYVQSTHFARFVANRLFVCFLIVIVTNYIFSGALSSIRLIPLRKASLTALVIASRLLCTFSSSQITLCPI